ncbi:TraI domain protein, partial [Escherichia coli EC1865]
PYCGKTCPPSLLYGGF